MNETKKNDFKTCKWMIESQIANNIIVYVANVLFLICITLYKTSHNVYLYYILIWRIVEMNQKEYICICVSKKDINSIYF